MAFASTADLWRLTPELRGFGLARPGHAWHEGGVTEPTPNPSDEALPDPGDTPQPVRPDTPPRMRESLTSEPVPSAARPVRRAGPKVREGADAMAPTGVWGRFVDYFSLKEAQTLATGTPLILREPLAQLAATARQKHKASECLWSAGHRAEGLLLMNAGLAAVSDLLERVHDAVGGHPRLDRSRELLGEPGVLGGDVPQLDQAITPEFELSYEKKERSFRKSLDQLEPFLRKQGELRWIRIRRAAGVVALVAGVAATLAFVLHKPTGVFASATDQQADFPAQLAMDGNPETEWQGNNRARPKLGITMHPPRTIRRLRLLNGHNRHFNDRAVKDYAVMFFAGSKTVHRLTGRFEKLAGDPDWVEHPLDLQNVDRVQFSVKSYFQEGAALAEIEFLEE